MRHHLYPQSLDPEIPIPAHTLPPLAGDGGTARRHWEALREMRATTRHRWTVAPHCTVRARDGRTLRGGDEVTLDDVDHWQAIRVLVGRGVVIDIGEDETRARTPRADATHRTAPFRAVTSPTRGIIVGDCCAADFARTAQPAEPEEPERMGVRVDGSAFLLPARPARPAMPAEDGTATIARLEAAGILIPLTSEELAERRGAQKRR